MGERGLTYKQQRFAELVASGCTNVGAFRSVYPSIRRGKATESEGAKRIAHLPKVVAEVQRLTLLRSPHDAAAQSEHIAARLLELTKSPEPEVALRAIAQWAELEKRRLLRPRPIEQHADRGQRPSDDERRQIINQLRALYQKTLPKPQNFAEQLGQPITELPKPHDLAIDVEPTDTASTLPTILEIRRRVERLRRKRRRDRRRHDDWIRPASLARIEHQESQARRSLG